MWPDLRDKEVATLVYLKSKRGILIPFLFFNLM